jgi:hypothetical protein
MNPLVIICVLIVKQPPALGLTAEMFLLRRL